jgi:hypothetical protein
MLTRGRPPFLECSTHGDRRFSAFCARPSCLGGRSIEQAYQAMKILPDGRTNLSWREAKGQPCINKADCTAAYEHWWLEWVREQNLLPTLQAATGLSDKFGRESSVCQADVLWRIRNGTLT